MPFQVLLAFLLALVSFLLATGMQVSGGATPQPFSQSVLIAHMAGGILVALILPAIVWLHPVRGADVALGRRLLGDGLGIVALLTGVAAIACGLTLPYSGNLSSQPELATWHCRAGGAFVAILLVHVALSWALRRRLVGSRPGAIARAAVAALVMLTVATVGAAALAPRVPVSKPIPKDYKKIGANPKTVFTPGRQATAHGQFLPVAALAGSFNCGTSGCHTQIVEEWKASMHRHAARNDHYRAQVKLRIHDVPVKPHAGARFCSACHEPIAVMSGEVDPTGRGIEFSENIEEGISCLACHRITEVFDVTGNGSYIMDAPRMATDGSSLLTRAAIRAKPAAHRTELMRPGLREPTFCAACHQLTVGPGIIKSGFFNVQQTYDEWLHTQYAVKSGKAYKRCQDCHMPLVDSTDPAARAGKHRSHRFPGANTMRPFLDGDKEQLEITQKFLKSGIVTLDLRWDGEVKPSSTARLIATVTNTGVGHRFPTGTVDMHDIWIELLVDDAAGTRVFASGLIDPKSLIVDPASAQFKSVPVDKDGKWLYRRDMWNLDRFQQRKSIADRLIIGQEGYGTLGQRSDFFNLGSLSVMRTVFPGAPDEEPYAFAVPATAKLPLTASARLRYRKSNQQFTDFTFDPRPLREGSGYTGPHKMGVSMPITDVAEARLTSAK
jgi:hypothetical protein